MKTRRWLSALTLGLLLTSQTYAASFRGLGELPVGFDQDKAYGISTDGAVVVGCGEGLFADEAFRWTMEGGLEGLGFLPGGEASCALAVSADGMVIVGYSASGVEREAFRWTRSGGMQDLGDLPGGGVRSVAHAVSADGEVVVGSGLTAYGEEAAIWTGGNLSNLRTLLTDRYGLDLGGWVLRAAKLVSADGYTIVGVGLNPDGESEAWVAHIGPKASAPVLTPPTGLRIVFE